MHFDTFNSLLNISIQVAAVLPILMFVHYLITSSPKAKSVTSKESTQLTTHEEPTQLTTHEEPMQLTTHEEPMQPETETDYEEAMEEIREDLGYQLEAMPEYALTLTISSGDGGTGNALKSKTRTELVRMLKDRNIKGYSKWNKAQMIEALI
jgi:hypothetical protein